jgi:hypothetical protein
LPTNEGGDNAWAHHSLEAPDLGEDGQINWELIWLYRRKKGVPQPRPIFTGDVFADVSIIGEDEPTTVVVLQHPCALLDKNNELRAILLTAKLVDYEEVSPKEWAGNYDVMPLVVHDSDPLKHQAVALDQLALVRSSDLGLEKRVACMEIEGVSRLLQRWTNVNTRVVVPCWRFAQVINAQFAEAEGMESWCAQRQQARVRLPDATKEATNWLGERNEDTGKPRRELLKDPRYRKNIVRRMYEVAKDMSDRDNAERARIKTEEKARREAEAAAAAEQEADSEVAPATPAALYEDRSDDGTVH